MAIDEFATDLLHAPQYFGRHGKRCIRSHSDTYKSDDK
jgi:hypothetical protein